MISYQIASILWESLAIFLALGALLGILIGLLLILRSRRVESIGRVANRWISTRHLNQLLDRSVSIEHWFYLHHRPLGIAVVLGAIYIFIYFGLLFEKAEAVRHWRGWIPPQLMEGLLDALVLSSLVGASLGLAVGLFLWLRPSLLRNVEAAANRWLSTRRATRVFDVPRNNVDRFVARHARRVGWLLLVGSFYLFFTLVSCMV